ncbi:probable serine/threonine-protein kinase cdc7 [Abrus precatorius]|uniref:non-specific serine/threonine protein kinase n=1 Tax=Abrus precatorius TaxID=3816 RepID=A0A8B8LP82_ABRPR|nr:probable serine/threonine-protein kinase cdc7 [Abrus precatorius]
MANPWSEFETSLELEEKAWHLLALLLRIGHAVYPQNLASQCRLFTASPDFICHVTSLTGSPLSVTDNGLVTPSVNAVFALGSFFSLHFPRSQTHCFRKRKLLFSTAEDGRAYKRLAISSGVQEVSFQSFPDTVKAVMRRNFPAIKFEPPNISRGNFVFPLRIESIDTNGECSGCSVPNFKHREANNDASTSMSHGEVSRSVTKASDSLFMTGSAINCWKLASIDRFKECNLFVNLALPTCFQDTSLCHGGGVGSIEFWKKMDYFDTFRHGYPEQDIIHSVDVDGLCKSNTYKDPRRESNEDDKMEIGSKKGLIGSDTNRDKEDVAQMVNPIPRGEELTNGSEQTNLIHEINLEKNKSGRNTKSTYKSAQSTASPKQLLKSSSILKGGQKNDLHPKSQILKESLACNKFDNVPKNVDRCKNDQKLITRKQNRKENMAGSVSTTPKVEKKVYPSFETFTIEEEEGSGGYGTVYRAQRTTDGKRVAIKCPHNNAHKNHVNNERNMLERFGGKNFIIKIEGSFKNGNSDCFVLEHVEHDRPEVLKKEIDIVQLQWYGYCMFRALASLHKEGVVHRDVKPGNFLFSRKLNKGYLIDFNLAMDLKQKYNIGSKSKPILDTFSNVPLSSGTSPLVQDKKLGGSKCLTSNKRVLADYKNYSELNRHVKQKAYAGSLKNCPDKAAGSLLRAQGTDGSGITSAKDVTSTRTASAERLREPIPFRGRKELISLVKNSMQCANNSSIKGPSSHRKRVTAPSGKVDGKIFYLTPMPLHSTTVAAGLLRSKGDGKHKREGSCVGTKGFRAPEVLFRSQFQGSKVDIWSAGVTLLYLMIGKTPFTGDPEQNIKEIAKLRGSEELWEVAKLHDRELSFPVELLDDRYLQSWDIESWCKVHTKRPEFHEHIPKSLFDLIDKCLTVNPRNRISVEDVLRHEFFASCNEIMRKQRMIRRGLSSDTAAQSKLKSVASSIGVFGNNS